MKTSFVVKVYILTTKNSGEWWEYVKKDGSTHMWAKGVKQFSTVGQAVKWCKKNLAVGSRYQVRQQVEPVEGSITWEETVVESQG